jgi:uncharacterized membrane protein
MSVIELLVDEHIGPILIFHIREYRFAFCFCHRRKDRSIRFFGLEKWFCSRCLGILLGSCAGLSLAMMNIRSPWYWTMILVIPMIIDGVSQASGYQESSNPVRLLTGFLFGCALPSLVFIFMDLLRLFFDSAVFSGVLLKSSRMGFFQRPVGA